MSIGPSTLTVKQISDQVAAILRHLAETSEHLSLNPLLRSFLLTASLLSAPVVAQSAASEAADPSSTDDQEEVILQILELKQQIEDLLTALPPEVRQEVERRWRDRLPTTEDLQPESTTGDEGSVTETEPVESTVEVAPIVDAIPVVEPVPTPSPSEEIAESQLPCGGFHLFDTNGDGMISGADRQWRFLRLWFDNGDRNLDETELGSLFELGVRQIDVNLQFYTNEEGDSEDVDAGELIELIQVGTGNSPRRTGVLVINSDRLARDGVLTLSGSEGGPLSGYQPLDAESFLAGETGARIPLICPDLD